MDSPIAYWTPSISPSGLTLYSGDRFPAWRGSLFLGALSAVHLRRLELQNGQVTNEEVLLQRGLVTHEGGLIVRSHRFRDVRQGPDGLLYVITDGGALLRLEPAL